MKTKKVRIKKEGSKEITVLRITYELSEMTMELFDLVKDHDEDGPILELLMISDALLGKGYSFDVLSMYMPISSRNHRSKLYNYDIEWVSDNLPVIKNGLIGRIMPQNKIVSIEELTEA